MPRTVEFQGVQHEFPDSATDDQVRDALTGHRAQAQASDPRAQLGKMVSDAAEGVGAGIASTALGAYDLVRKIPGVSGILPEPNAFARDVAKAPDSVAGSVGKGVEQVAEFLVPMSKVTLASKALPLAGRLGAKALAAGAIAGVQTGGDPRAMALTAGTEGVLGGVGAVLPAAGTAIAQKLIDAGPRPLSAGALAVAEKLGIPVSRGTAGGSRFVQAVEKTLGNTVAHDMYEGMVTKGQQGIDKGVSKLAGDFAVDQFAAGDGALKKLITHSSEHEHEARASYDALSKFEADPANIQAIKTGEKTATSAVLDASGKPIVTTTPITEQIGLPVDAVRQKSELRPIRDRIMKQLPFAQQQYSKGLQAIQNILDGPDVVPASVAEANISALKTIQREAVDGKVKELVGKLIASAEPAIQSAVAEAGPDATKALLTGRAAWKEHAKTLELIDTLAGDTTGKSGQVKVAQRLLRPADASYPELERVLAAAPDAAPALREAFMGRVFKKAETGEFTNPAQAANLWNQIGKRTKAALFEPEHIADINSTLELAKRLAENPNPSGTGAMNALLKIGVLAMHPVAGVASFVGGRKLARVLYEPEGAAALHDLFASPNGPGATRSLSIVKALADRSAAGGAADGSAQTPQIVAPASGEIRQ